MNADLESLLQSSISKKASDVHLTPNLPPVFRIDGDLIPQSDQSLSADNVKSMIYSMLTKDQELAFERKFDLDFALALPDGARFRVNIFYHDLGTAAVLRLISVDPPSLDDIYAPPIFKKLLDIRAGLFIIAGPTGSGKSTTLAAMLRYINELRADHIITIEDPIEYVHKSIKSVIQQRQLYQSTKTFSGALRASLREDPDVIFVGEIRDAPTLKLALTAAETGHLVLTTLHTSTAPRAVSRMVDLFPSNDKEIVQRLIAESLLGVVCQTLIKRIDGGRVAAFEIMLGTNAIRNLIRENKIAQMYSVIETNSQMGMCTMEKSIELLINNHIIAATDVPKRALNDY